MENKVYNCGWSRSSEGFCLWTTTKPAVRVTATTYAQAEDEFLEAIREQGGAMHSVLEFVPPLPPSELTAKYSSPELYLISGDDRFQTDAPRSVPFETAQARESRLIWLDSFYQAPVCRRCVAPTASRSERPLLLAHAPADDGAFGQAGTEGSTHIQIVSEDFLALLSEDERERLMFHPVSRKGRGRKFFELVGPVGTPFVGVMNLPVKGWGCSACNRSTWGYWVDGLAIHSFMAASDLPQPLPGIFTVGTATEIHLCATGARWRELVGKKGVRGFVSRPFGVVSDRELVRLPSLASHVLLNRSCSNVADTSTKG